MTTYNVTAKRWTRGWELHIDGLGVTQSSTLGRAEKMVREYIALALDLADETGFDVTITPEVEPDVAAQIDAARTATRDAERAQLAASQQWSGVVRSLKERGLAGTDVARILRISEQRVSQLSH